MKLLHIEPMEEGGEYPCAIIAFGNLLAYGGLGTVLERYISIMLPAWWRDSRVWYGYDERIDIGFPVAHLFVAWPIGEFEKKLGDWKPRFRCHCFIPSERMIRKDTVPWNVELS